jgi:hypothetical protein
VLKSRNEGQAGRLASSVPCRGVPPVPVWGRDAGRRGYFRLFFIRMPIAMPMMREPTIMIRIMRFCMIDLLG